MKTLAGLTALAVVLISSALLTKTPDAKSAAAGAELAESSNLCTYRRSYTSTRRPGDYTPSWGAMAGSPSHQPCRRIPVVTVAQLPPRAGRVFRRQVVHTRRA